VWELVDERIVTPSDQAIRSFVNRMQPPPTRADAWYQARGGSFKYPLDAISIWDEASTPALWKADDIGFRCVKDAQ
jgi:hypothetical protein